LAKVPYNTASADFYKYRTPYSPGFFTKLAEALPCRPESDLLDMACGTGVLSIGMERFARSIAAIDASAEMIAAAPESAKITYLQGDLNADLLRGPRVIHWFALEKLKATVDAVLAPGGRLAVCSSGLSDQAPWVREFSALRRQYNGTRENISHGDAMRRLPEIGFEPLNRITDVVGVRAKPGLFFRHALAYGRSRPAILANQERFRVQLDQILRPCLKDGFVEVPILSWAVIHGRAGARREQPEPVRGGTIWD
jgi:SAM-dependent methyltransferase